MRLRVRFAKLGRVRWTSHRDVARMWERALRRGGLPVAYTEGFSPRPQLSFGLALPTGCESTAEYLDVSLRDDVDPGTFAGLLSPLLPEGVDVRAAAVLAPGTPSLQEVVDGCAWDVDVPDVDVDVLAAAVARALASPSLPVERERKGRRQVDDVRSALLALEAHPAAHGRGSRLVAEVSTRPRGVRPAELAAALGLELGAARRTCQWIERDGARLEPLEVPDEPLAPALGRAS
ncbi:MAG TPA: TIGR03936 family radical SAM-associated protein [Acidimicrobiales bacterium]|nr:TIGR03936 family radical SAM-associated protein [Acidimicrobiales bacterium]